MYIFLVLKFILYKTWEPLNVEAYYQNGYNEWGVIWKGSEEYEDKQDR